MVLAGEIRAGFFWLQFDRVELEGVAAVRAPQAVAEERLTRLVLHRCHTETEETCGMQIEIILSKKCLGHIFRDFFLQEHFFERSKNMQTNFPILFIEKT